MNRKNGIVLLVIWVVFTLFPINIRRGLIISFLDVGQGDSILVKTPNNKYLLFDGGPDLSVLYELGRRMGRSSSIALVVLTHPHADHINGLNFINKRNDVENIFINDVNYKNDAWDELKLTCSLSEKCVNLGVRSEVAFSIDGVNINMWAPDCEGYVKNVNNCSIVTLLEYKNFRVLLMGDAEHEEEKWMLSKYSQAIEEIDVLKAGHHCSRTASGEDFLDFISPNITICSVGQDNTFGHPHSETIENLKTRNIPILRTDLEGTIVLVISDDGSTNLKVKDRTYQL